MLLLAAAAPCRVCCSLPLLLAAAPCDGCSAPGCWASRWAVTTRRWQFGSWRREKGGTSDSSSRHREYGSLPYHTSRTAPAAKVLRSRRQQQHDEILAGVAHIAMVDQLRIGADLGKCRSGGRGRLSLGVAVTGMAVVARCRLGGGDAGESGMAMVARDREFREER
ncbi:hypothetical protein TRIUR3_11231 [Triticum urartu]|uniref:Secreted protein n=1 Tax=Triticum urartu TaxID=4572 RepID=M7ZH35_TRIUA|nr:hypothetical protein TRIUR3_11231 [Triticum urartu]